MISFNFESSIIMLISKQHNIKFVIIIKTFNIKLVLFYIIFKNNVINKKRFNFIDEPIFKPQYSDIFFDSNTISNFDISRKINIKIFNL